MTIPEFKKVARLIKEALARVKEEALEGGVDITAPEFDNVVDAVRESILSRHGFSVEEYREAKELALKEQATKRESSSLNKVIQSIEKVKGEKGDPGDHGHTPTDEELLALMLPLIPHPRDGEDGRTPTAKELLKLIKPLIPKVRDGKDGKPGTTKVTVDKKAVKKLEKRLSGIKIPKEIDVAQLKGEIHEDFKGYFAITFEKNINLMGMPNFRKLALGLDAKIDERIIGTSDNNSVPKLTVSDTEPTGPKLYDLWVDIS